MLRSADRAQFERDGPKLTAIVGHLKELSISKQEQSCTEYYEASLALRYGHRDEAVRTFEQVLEHAPGPYAARSLMSLSCIEAYRGNLERALKLCKEASVIASTCRPQDPLPIFLLRDRAALLSFKGDHRSALRALQAISPSIPILGHQQQAFVLDYYNSLATELQSNGDSLSAQFFAQIATSSPLASRFPEWAETAQEIEIGLQAKGHRIRRPTPAPSLRTIASNEIIPPPVIVSEQSERPLAKILPFSSQRPVPVPEQGRVRAALIAKLIDDLIEAIGAPTATADLLKFMDWLLLRGVTQDEISRMTRLLSRKRAKHRNVASRE